AGRRRLPVGQRLLEQRRRQRDAVLDRGQGHPRADLVPVAQRKRLQEDEIVLVLRFGPVADDADCQPGRGRRRDLQERFFGEIVALVTHSIVARLGERRGRTRKLGLADQRQLGRRRRRNQARIFLE